MKIAVVTGASKGMGLEWVRQLSAQGYAVVLTARTQAKAAEAAASLAPTQAPVWPQQLDVANPAEVAALVQWLTTQAGQVDVLINNAGINSRTRGAQDERLFRQNVDIDHLAPAEVLNMVQVNALAPILLAQQLRPLLAKAPQPKIINISSWMSSLTLKRDGGNYSYAVSKAALNMMNRAFAQDIKAQGIVSVVVNPGWVQTDMGGQKAKLTSQESVQAMISQVLDRITLAQTGQFFHYDGTTHPW